jgi:hypothetical protein
MYGGELHIGFWKGGLREDPEVDGRVILRWIFR